MKALIKNKKLAKSTFFSLLAIFLILHKNFAEPLVELKIAENEPVSSTMQIILILTFLVMLPSILLMMTCFTRIIIIFSFIRRALSLQNSPPNQVLIGLSLFLTIFVMGPVFSKVYSDSYLPLSKGEINQEQAYEKAMEPMRDFMFKQVRKSDLALFIKISNSKIPTKLEDVETIALIPAFIISELKTGFIVGFLLFIPFIVIDMIVASTLMSLGMMMLPPVMISMPFKLLLFIMVDGWALLVKSIVEGIKI